jgi:hypothetical protein
MTNSSLGQKIYKYWDELPTRLCLIPVYGTQALYMQLGGPRKLTPRELEDAKFNPDNYRAKTYGQERDISDGYDKLMEIRAIPISATF